MQGERQECRQDGKQVGKKKKKMRDGREEERKVLVKKEGAKA